jgi:hypothetical protein
MRELTEKDIEITRELLRSEIGTRSLQGGRPEESYALGGEFLGIIVNHVLIPILVSLSSRGLYDLLKVKVLGQLSERESKDVAAELVRSPVSLDKEELSPEAFQALASELQPMGFTSEDIASLYRKVRLRLCAEESSNNVPERSSSHT